MTALVCGTIVMHSSEPVVLNPFGGTLMKARLWSISLLLVLGQIPVFGTICGGKTLSVVESYTQASAVFIAKASRVERFTSSGTLTVQARFKGDVPDEIKVVGASSGSYPFEEGKVYLVYADSIDKKGVLQIGICGRTKLFQDAKSEIKDIQEYQDRTKALAH
jgi:hypothetical protein